MLGDVYYVPEVRNCLLMVRQMDRQGVSTSFSEGLCEMRDRATEKVVLNCRIQDTNGLYTLLQEQFENQLGVGHQLCMAHSIQTDPASRLHYILNHSGEIYINIRYGCFSTVAQNTFKIKYPVLKRYTLKQLL